VFLKAAKAWLIRPGVLATDAMTDKIAARAPEVFDLKWWPEFQTYWREWTYVWDRRYEFEEAIVV